MINNASLIKLTELRNLLAAVTSRRHRLILVVGPVGAGKTPLLGALSRDAEIPYVNLNLVLSERLLDLTVKQRPLRVGRLLAGILDEQLGETVCLDNIELLFDPVLRQDPLACLQGLSRSKTLVVAWGGQLDRGVLTYAEPGHPEYHRYDHPDAVTVALA
jgi:hypothetical protein